MGVTTPLSGLTARPDAVPHGPRVPELESSEVRRIISDGVASIKEAAREFAQLVEGEDWAEMIRRVSATQNVRKSKAPALLESSLAALSHEVKCVVNEHWRKSPEAKEGRGYEAFDTSWKILELTIDAADRLFTSHSCSREAGVPRAELARIEQALAASLIVVKERCDDFDRKAGAFAVV